VNDDIILNGINGTTGQYLVPPFSSADAVNIARGRPSEGLITSWLKAIVGVLKRPKLGLPMDVDPINPARAGWAIVFPAGAPVELRDAIQPLLNHRKKTVPPDRCKVLEYRPGETMKKWLTRYGIAPGTVTPTKVPYYLTLVGDPTQIPFEFQYLLDIEYAVGRLSFDAPALYRQYAESVATYETATALPNAREVVYWGPRHAMDRSTQMSADSLIGPLAEGDAENPEVADGPNYRSRCFKVADATKTKLLEVLHSVPPAVLFTASHGMGWPKDDARQRPAQGALLCQDWPGFGQVAPTHYLTAAEVTDAANVRGLIAFLFACYGAGTPATDNFLTERNRGPVTVASAPFVAALPQRLLSHPNGGALAVVGHVERAWGYSIRPSGPTAQIGPFRDFLARVLAGEPVGHATKNFSERYAVLSTALLSQLDETSSDAKPSPQEIAATWVERNDAQNYVVLGDPAVRLRPDLLE
jgi:Peptidase family C25